MLCEQPTCDDLLPHTKAVFCAKLTRVSERKLFLKVSLVFSSQYLCRFQLNISG